MEIKTKYNIGDKVWYKYEDRKPSCAKIAAVHVWLTRFKEGIKQQTVYTVGSIMREERFIFPTKEELLKSL